MRIKFTLLICIIISFLDTKMYSQGIDINTVAEKFFISLNINTSLNNVSLSNSIDNNSSFIDKGMLNPSITFDYMFSSKIGLRSGIGIRYFRKNLSRDSTLKSINGTDTDNDSYTLNVAGKNISEKNQVLTIDIPIGLVIMKPLFNKVGFYLIPEVALSVPVYAKNSGSGIYSFEAFYPKYNLTLKGIPEHGLYSNKLIEGNKKPDLVSLIISGGAETGFSYKTKRDFSVLFGLHYFQSFSNILKTHNDGLTPPALPYSELPEYKSVLESNKEAVLQSYGIQISLRYLIK